MEQQQSSTERGMRRADGTPRDATDFMDRTALAIVAACFVVFIGWLSIAALFSLERVAS